MTTTITHQKVRSILSAAHLRDVSVAGAYSTCIVVEFSGAASDRKSNMAKAASALKAKGIESFIKVHQSSTYRDITLLVSKVVGEDVENAYPYDQDRLDEAWAPRIADEVKYLAERKAERERKEFEEKARKARKMAEAKRINPKLDITILEQNLDGSKGVAYCAIKDSLGCSHYILARWEKRHAFFNEGVMTYSLSIAHEAGLNARGVGGGSTSVDGAESLEEAIYFYVATWHVE